MTTKLTIQEFVSRSQEIHEDKYDYSLVEYKNSNTKVKIICLIHGLFEQTPDNHINKNRGCSKCAYESKALVFSSQAKSEFKDKANQIHNMVFLSRNLYTILTDLNVKNVQDNLWDGQNLNLKRNASKTTMDSALYIF